MMGKRDCLAGSVGWKVLVVGMSVPIHLVVPAAWTVEQALAVAVPRDLPPELIVPTIVLNH
jgi:hypothetical protein